MVESGRAPGVVLQLPLLGPCALLDAFQEGRVGRLVHRQPDFAVGGLELDGGTGQARVVGFPM